MTSREKRRNRNEASTHRSDLENHDALTWLMSGEGAVVRTSSVLCVERHAQGGEAPLAKQIVSGAAPCAFHVPSLSQSQRMRRSRSRTGRARTLQRRAANDEATLRRNSP